MCVCVSLCVCVCVKIQHRLGKHADSRVGRATDGHTRQLSLVLRGRVWPYQQQRPSGACLTLTLDPYPNLNP